MTSVPFAMTALFLFSAVFNFGTSALMFYLRTRSGTTEYTKSQLWGITILAWLFLLNGLATLSDLLFSILILRPDTYAAYPPLAMMRTGRLVTAVLLVMFGLVYPRPSTGWDKLRYVLLGLLFLSFGITVMDIMEGRNASWVFANNDPLPVLYMLAYTVPVHIWMSQYSRQPSEDGRMMYTILIWGLLFTYLSEQMLLNLTGMGWGKAADTYLVINDMLILVTIIRLGYILWGQRARWSSVEWYHIGLLLSSLAIGAFAAWRKAGDRYVEDPVTAIAIYFAISFGWMVIRPALFSYGLLRYRLLGTNIRAERALAVIAGVLFSTIIFLGIIAASGNAATGDMFEWDQTSMGAALVVSIIVFFPAWIASERFATRLLPVSAGAASVTMREKRNIYLMALQTATVAGRIDDDDDAEAVYNLRRELGVTDREHDLLVETIAVHEGRRHSRNDVEQAYLITKDGRLIAYYEPGQSSPSAVDDVDEKDVVAGMLTAVKDFVGEAMKEEPGLVAGAGPKAPEEGPLRSSMDAISYGSSTLLIEMDMGLVLAMVVNGQDDPSLRQAMRDTLAEVNEAYLSISGGKWDGDRRGLEGVWSILNEMAVRVEKEQT